MRRSRVAWNSAVALGASLCWLPNLASAQTVYLGAGGEGINPTGATPNPNRSNGAGGQFGNNSDIIQSVVITEGYEDIQNGSTTIPGNAVTAPAIFFQINVYSPAGSPTDITTSSGAGYYTDYDLGLETSSAPDKGLVTTPTTVSQAFGAPFGISTGMNYFISGFNNKATSPSTAGGNSVYTYSTTSATSGPLNTWNLVAGATGSPYSATSTTITTTSMTYGIPLADLGLAVGNSFTFDAYDTFPGNSTYDDLDDPNFAPAGYFPYSNGAGTPTPFDSATEAPSLASYTVITPTLTWNNTPASVGGDGVTWVAATNGTVPAATAYNWNNGLEADYYVDGSNVVFNDNNGGNYNVTLTSNDNVSPGSITINNSAGSYVISGAGSIAGTGSLSKSGTGTATLSTDCTYTGGTNVSAGTLVIGANGALADGPVNITGGTLQLAASTGLAQMTSLAITGNGALDVANNHVIITYGHGTDPISSIAALLKTGYNGGHWNGLGGIDSSTAAVTPGYGVGYADSADTGNPANLSSGTIEIKYTLLGDANLDGTVNGIDFGILAANFNKGVTGWDKGDFNYDNVVSGIDFGDLAANFNKGASGASVGGPAWTDPALLAFAAANGLLADVPEPATTGLLTVCTMGILAKRRRVQA